MWCLCAFLCIMYGVSCGCCFFFFKQKTAYEMRISDWSSDVCSSDLVLVAGQRMADQDRVGALGIQSAVGLVGEGEGAEGDAAVERQRHVAAELHGQAALRLRIVRRRPGGAGSGPVHCHR